jgi:broad specificity phosphatase PhoE
VPGPNLTPEGELQALEIAPGLAAGAFDGIYYSDMIRTYQTAQPLMGLEPALPTEELGGFREISAGIFEGVPIDEGLGRIGYFLIPLTWGLGLRSIPIPLGEGGNEFQDRFSSAVSTVIANGDVNPVIFSHGASIMVWTAMNVDNPDIGLLLSNPLQNAKQVVVQGNEEDGWTMISYSGTPVDQNPGLLTQLFVNARDLIVAPQTAVYNVVQAIGTFNLQNIVVAVVDGAVSVIRAAVDFVVNSVTDIVNAIIGVLPGAASSTAPVTAASVKPAAAAVEVPAATEPDTASIATAPTARPGDTPQISARTKARTAAAADSATASDGDSAAPAKAAAESSRRADSPDSDESGAGSADAPAKASSSPSSSTRRVAEKAAA